MNHPIYLDYAATTPVDPYVAEKMLQYLQPNGIFGNPASTHSYGSAAKEAVESARLQVANMIHADPTEIIWTSGATEANNLALKGAAALYQRKGKHIITVKTEHAAVLDCCQELEKQGFSVTYLAVEKNGLLNLEHLAAALRDDTILVSVMHVNNELGIIQPLADIAALTSARDILLHVDAAQSIGKVMLDVTRIPADLVSMSAHKVYGAKGVGALYVRRKPRVRVAAQIHGGGQEQGMRSGTLPTHQIVSMGAAFSLAKNLFSDELARITQLRDQFWQGISSIEGVVANTDFAHAVPHIINVRFPHFTSAELMKRMPQLAISAGSACHAKGTEPSRVLRAMGLTHDEANASLRFSLGRFTTSDEINEAIQIIKQATVIPA